MASGMQSSLKILMGECENLTVFDAYLDESCVQDHLDAFYETVGPEDEVLLCSDLFGGSYYSVPNAHNDFVLSWIGNATGFVGCCVVLGILFALVCKTFATGARSEDMLGSFICAGIGGALMAQIAVNVGMNLRVLPVIGVTLPFYSAGGSSVLMLYICVGLVLSVYMHNTKKLFG